MSAGAVPPDDFIDTTAVDEPGTECLAVDFERQELRVIFETMDRNNIFYKMLAEDQIVSMVFVSCWLLRVNHTVPELARSKREALYDTLCLVTRASAVVIAEQGIPF